MGAGGGDGGSRVVRREWAMDWHRTPLPSHRPHNHRHDNGQAYACCSYLSADSDKSETV